MSYPTSPFVVIAGGHEVGDLPTPALIENGGGEAYQMEGGAWRLRDDEYDEAQAIKAAGKAGVPGATAWRAFLPKYTRVRVVSRRECPGYIGISHYTEYGATFVNGLCPQCDTYREEDRRARADARARERVGQ